MGRLMDFNLSEEQLTFQNSVRSLAEKYLSKDNLLRAHEGQSGTRQRA